MGFPSTYLLAFLLITSPPGEIPFPESKQEKRVFVETYAQNLEVYADVCLDLEIMDPREKKSRFIAQKSFLDDVRFMQKRYQILKDAPPLSDVMRLPTREIALEMLSLNRRYQAHVEGHRKIAHPRHQIEIMQILCEIQSGYDVWDAILDAQTGYYYLTYRRECLKRLKKKIGEEAYDLCMYPPVVPLERFKTID